MNAALDAVGLEVSGHSLVSNVSLEFNMGSLTVVIGPNGAGKTTLLRLLAGDATPTSGTVSYDGEHLRGISVSRMARLRSVLPQRPSSESTFSVEQIVSMGRYAYRVDTGSDEGADRDLLDEVLGLLDLVDLRSRQVRSLSGGEQQRVALARVLAQQTPLVLLDEPTTALDIRHQESVMVLLERLPREDHTVVVVLHDLSRAATFDQVVLLHRGEIAAAGRPKDVLTSELLSAVYEHPIDVVTHPKRPGLLVLPRTPI